MSVTSLIQAKFSIYVLIDETICISQYNILTVKILPIEQVFSICKAEKTNIFSIYINKYSNFQVIISNLQTHLLN